MVTLWCKEKRLDCRSTTNKNDLFRKAESDGTTGFSEQAQIQRMSVSKSILATIRITLELEQFFFRNDAQIVFVGHFTDPGWIARAENYESFVLNRKTVHVFDREAFLGKTA